MLKPTFTTVALAATPGLLAAALIWLIRCRGAISRPRYKLFLAGWLANVLAYTAYHLLRWFLRHSQLNFYDQADLILGVGGLTFLAAFVSLIASFFGKSYGRICALFASVLVGALWWLTSIGGLRW